MPYRGAGQPPARPGRHPRPATLSALTGETAALAQYPTVALSVTPVPETIDTLAEHDRTTGTHLVSTLRAAIGPPTVPSGTYVPVDSGAWVAHGLADGYDRQLRAGDQAADAQLGPDVVDTAAVARRHRHARSR